MCQTLSSTGDFGCRVSSHDGLQLPLYGVFDGVEILNKFVSESHLKLSQKVAAVLSASYFNESIVSQIVTTGKVGAILVLDDGTPSLMDTESMTFSTDTTTPLGADTPFSDLTWSPGYVWNPSGNALAWDGFDMPIVMVKEDSVQEVYDAAAHNLKTGLDAYPVYHANMEFYFGKADVTSVDCLGWEDIDGSRDPQCLPLGGQSVWATQGVRDTRPVIMAVGGIDSAAMFHQMSFGANDAVATIVTILAAAEMLGRAESTMSALSSQIAFGLFQAEEWGYIGSRRFVADISSFTCNNIVDGSKTDSGIDLCLDPLYPSLAFESLSLDDIEHVIAVDQVGLKQSSSGTADLYVRGSDSASTLISSLVAVGNEVSNDLTVAEAQASSSGTYDLPPSPATSFLNADSEISAALISGYNLEFTDAAYHTPYDEGTRLDSDVVALAAQFLAESLYVTAGGDSSVGLGVDVDSGLVSELLSCMTQNSTCSLMEGYIHQDMANLKADTGLIVDYGYTLPPMYYSGVFGSGVNGQPTFSRNYDDGSLSYGRFTEEYDENTDFVYTVPSSLETFIRAFLADKMAQGSFRASSCSTSDDCGYCGDAYFNGTQECVQGSCACRTAFFHMALDPGLEATESLSVFDIVDDSAPIVTEPNWKYIGVEVYPFAGDYICYLSVAIGAFVTIVSATTSLYLKKSLQKEKLL
eukprot:CAMPEP_0117754072 /NCGR_PEP_ID=MMETSP0947-20121206/12613_1 /TAXON_ID=44440 /ORGANISM="Chattonella subsalsa, Strain CCMP2191" /LENGTH=694 /DNA_ID=CAMNT_0005573095 /DNA_START=196 /DNA_END=2281 /DNA_ORIENTATION=-